MGWGYTTKGTVYRGSMLKTVQAGGMKQKISKKKQTIVSSLTKRGGEKLSAKNGDERAEWVGGHERRLREASTWVKIRKGRGV